MSPYIGRIAFTSGFAVFVMALVLLPFLSPTSPEFVADVLALIISGFFLGLVVWSVRRAARLQVPKKPVSSGNQNHDPRMK